jgi:fluoride exporter
MRPPTDARMRALAVLAGGAAGALARAGVAEALPHEPGTWPWSTFTVNVAGAAALGWLTTRLTEVVAPTRYWRFLLGTGLCGALTTFSAFTVEIVQIGREGHVAVAAGYALASVAAGMLAAAGATVLVRRRRYG